MSALTYTRRLIEHRYGRPLEDLQRSVHHPTPTDPVLPVLLRRLADLADTHNQVRTARERLESAWQHRDHVDEHHANELIRSATAVLDLQKRQYKEAEVIWDLLDIRLLLDQPKPQSGPTTPRPQPDHHGVEELMPTARQVAARLPRLNRETLRHGLHQRGIHLSNHRLGLILRHLREEHPRP